MRGAAWLCAVGCSSHPATPQPIVAPLVPDAATAIAPPDAAEEAAGDKEPCLHPGAELTAMGSAPVLCGSSWSECYEHELPDEDGIVGSCCLKVDVAAGTFEHVAEPRHVTIADAPIPSGIKLGKKLAAAIAVARKEPPSDGIPVVQVTRDDVAIVIDRRAWSVAKDAPIALVMPPMFDRKDAVIVQITAIGDVLVHEWANCAAACHETRVATSSGTDVGPPIDGYISILQVSDAAVAIGSHEMDLKQTRTNRLYDLHTGKVRGTLPVELPEKGLGERLAVRLAGDAFVVAKSAPDDATRLVVVSVADPDKPVIAHELVVKACTQ